MGCKAQNPVIDLSDRDGERNVGAYYKDMNFVLNPFVGTWLYTNGNDTLKIVFKKIVQNYNTKYYEDFLIGEYQYIKNGEELYNTLSDINSVLPIQTRHSIVGNTLPTTTTPFNDYTTNNFRVRLAFNEDSPFACRIEIRKTEVNGVDAIQVFKTSKPPDRKNGMPYLGNAMIQDGWYTLVKVP